MAVTKTPASTKAQAAKTVKLNEEKSGKISNNEMVALKECLVGGPRRVGLKNEGVSQESFLAILLLIDSLESRYKLWMKQWGSIFEPFLDKGVTKTQGMGRTSYDYDKTPFKDEINTKIEELGDLEVSIKPVEFLSDEELFTVTKGLPMRDLNLIRKFLHIKA